MPKVSVLLSSYNHEKYISEAVNSALAQTFEDFELFIVDDCSDDLSWQVIESYGDHRITAIRNETRKGKHLFYNISRLTGQYIAIHHSDDSWEPEKLQKQVEYMDSHPETIACFTHVQLIDEHSRNYEPPEDAFYHSVFEQPNRSRFEWLRYFFDKGNALCHPSLLIRKEAYEDLGLFNFGLRQIPDFLRWIRVCLAGEIHVVQEKLTKFRLHTISERNVSGDNAANHLRGATEYFMICDDFFKISSDEVFFKVFPEYAGKDVVAEFVLSRMMVEKDLKPMQLYGLRKIFGMINDPGKAQQIRDIHKYTYIDFVKDTEKYDAFSIRNTLTFLNASLFIDYGLGLGYNDIDRVTKEVYVMQSGLFYVSYEFPEPKRISGLRFDPDEGGMWDISLDSVSINGVERQAQPLNSFQQNDGYCAFFTTDPIYILDAPEQFSRVEISGHIRPLSVDLANAVKAENISLQGEKANLQSENASLANDLANLQSENASLANDLANLQSENVNLANDLANLQGENANLANDLANLQGENASLANDLDTIKRSRLLVFVSRFSKAKPLFKQRQELTP